MVFVSNPNLPEKTASLAVIDYRTSDTAEYRLNSLGVATLRLKPHSGLYAAVSGHPDMQLHHIGGRVIVYAPGTDPVLLKDLAVYGFELIAGKSLLGPSYPSDIAYNAARVGKLYFHNLRFTDPVLKCLLEEAGIEPVHVEQGYSKCSILPVDGKSIITTDAGIAKAAERKGIEALLVDYERSIRLPGLNYGFIGGAAGMIGNSLCAINGNMRHLDCFKTISSYFIQKGIEVVELSEDCVTDIGSILPLIAEH